MASISNHHSHGSGGKCYDMIVQTKQKHAGPKVRLATDVWKLCTTRKSAVTDFSLKGQVKKMTWYERE